LEKEMGKKEAGGSRIKGEEGGRRRARSWGRKWGRRRLDEAGLGGKVKKGAGGG
jgi:hypothetical protein